MSLTLKLLYLYTILYDYFEKILINVKKNPYVNTIINKYYELINKMTSDINNLNIEPIVPYIEISYIDDKFNLIEEKFNDCITQTTLSNYYSKIITHIYDTNNVLYNKNVLFIHKFENNNKLYVQSKIIKKLTNELSKHFDLDNSHIYNIFTHVDKTNKFSYEFMGIEYNHPNMTESIEIKLDKNYFVSNNDILDNISVYKYLKRNYNSKDYVFDDKYKISIIDADVSFHEIKYNQYLHFNKDDKKWVILNN